MIRGLRAVASYQTRVPEFGEVDGFVCKPCYKKAWESTKVRRTQLSRVH